jgi:hypothetical protein
MGHVARHRIPAPLPGELSPLHQTLRGVLESKMRRIYLARRAAVLAGLTDDGLDPQRAERWAAAWEAIGDDPTASDYWRRGAAWIAAERVTKR